MEQSGYDLIVQFNHGNTQAFTAIYNEHHATLYYFVRRFINEREDAEDITATIFVKLWKLHADFESIQNIKAFLYITARNACLDFLRSRQRQHEKQKELLHILLQAPAEGILQEDIRGTVLKRIHEEIGKLPKSCKKVFEMSFLDGMSNTEIAEALQINNQSVRNNKQRALKLLRIAILNRDVVVTALVYCGFLSWFAFR
jgi:RNA polymerase sigma-70 factor (family 1)